MPSLTSSVIEWTPKERAEWEHKKRSAGLTRDQIIEKYKGQLTGYGFTESELSALFNADKRSGANGVSGCLCVTV
jgi:hypothetical protein